MLLWKALSHVLRLQGVEVLCVDREVFRRFRKLPPLTEAALGQWLAVYLALGKLRIRPAKNERGSPTALSSGITIALTPRGLIPCDAVAELQRGEAEPDPYALQALAMLPPYPQFVVDLSLWELHTDTEKSELVKQFMVLVDTLRNYLFDTYLTITSTPLEFEARIPREMALAVNFRTEPLHTYLKRFEGLRIVLLDPYAEEALTIDDARSAHIFVLGGIIDKEFPRPYATTMLSWMNRLEELSIARRSIKLRASTIGVPDRLNKIVEIVLRTRLEGLDVETSILEAMSLADKLARFVYEVSKVAGREKRMCWSTARSILEGLAVPQHSWQKALSKIRDVTIDYSC